jgi:hypothetical protein
MRPLTIGGVMVSVLASSGVDHGFELCSSLQIFGGFEVYGVKRHFQQYFSYIVAVNFIGGGNLVRLQIWSFFFHIDKFICRQNCCLKLLSGAVVAVIVW